MLDGFEQKVPFPRRLEVFFQTRNLEITFSLWNLQKIGENTHKRI